MVILVGYLAMLLTASGCTSKEFHLGWYDKCVPKTVVEVRKEYPSIGRDKLTCTEIPKPGEIKLQSELASYLVDLTVAGKECRSDLLYVDSALRRFRDSNTTE